ncbi:50S ribosomal protein L24 [Candidatus Gottesmanbacteria bacterium]|nr:50S ribosomal protein L24 [Candidatus Gottesmanbacteria bacterium]
MKFKKNDTVIITAGKDKGKQGSVLDIFPQDEKVLVSNLNQYKRHIKKEKSAITGRTGIVTFSRPIPVSNIALICPKCKKRTRVGFSITKNEKVRICKKCNLPI